MSFTPRLTAPQITNKYWKHVSSGGLNDCILISNGSVLPNCVGYAFGRAYEILGTYPKLCKNNANRWISYNDGYERGTTPRLGAIACWDKLGGAGHVAVVEQINEDGSIVTSNSAYLGTRFYLSTLKPPYNNGSYIFQGFIYLPIEEDQNISNNSNNELPKKSNEEIADEIIKGKGDWGNGSERVTKLTNAGYDYNAIQSIINDKLLPKTNTTKTQYNVGDIVYFDYFYTDSYASKKVKSAIHSGKITKIYEGRKAPYLINNTAGFLSDDLILM